MTPHARVDADASPPSQTVEPGREVLNRLASFVLRLTTSAPPALGTVDWVAPPTEAELGWIGDRALPIERRLERAREVAALTLTITRSFGGQEDPTGLVYWLSSLVCQTGHLFGLLYDEVAPARSLDDPRYAADAERLRRFADEGVEVVGALIDVLVEQPLPPLARREAARALREHAGMFARAWSADQRARVVATLLPAQRAERDHVVAAALADIGLTLLPSR